MKQVEREGDIALSCCGNDFGDGSALHAELAGLDDLSEIFSFGGTP